MRSGDKLYIVTRADLPPAQQAVQAVHAARQFAEEYPETETTWFAASNYVALLSVPTEADLHELLDRASGRGVLAAGFREPDLASSLTAVALEPRAKAMVRKLPLALGGR
jgi:hypothetical protein